LIEIEQALNSSDENDFKDILKVYTTDISIDKAKFIPCAAYIEGGEIKDILFDSFIFTPTPKYMYDFSPTGGRRLLTKEDFLDFVYNQTFRPGYNMDALELATNEVKIALNMPTFKFNVYLSLLYPNKLVTNFGEVNERSLNLSMEEDRIDALKWLIQEQIRVFEERNCRNLQIAGFFWFTEETKMKEDSSMIKRINDHIHNIGFSSIWSPYFNAQGWDKWRELGFDLATMQANYCPGCDIPNNGGIDRLYAMVDYVKRGMIGIEMEIATARHDCVKGFKEYLLIGAGKGGYMYGNHIWYLCGGAQLAYELAISNDSYLRSAYQEMYQFVKKSLEPDKILL